MRVKDYSTLKSASMVAFSKDEDVVSLTEKKFNPSTGVALDDVVHEVELSHYKSEKVSLEAEKAELETDISELAKIIEDIEAL